jgi:hypothetical protein
MDTMGAKRIVVQVAVYVEVDFIDPESPPTVSCTCATASRTP